MKAQGEPPFVPERASLKTAALPRMCDRCYHTITTNVFFPAGSLRASSRFFRANGDDPRVLRIPEKAKSDRILMKLLVAIDLGSIGGDFREITRGCSLVIAVSYRCDEQRTKGNFETIWIH